MPEPPVPFSLPYSGERLRWAISVIGWPINEAARRLNIDNSSLRQMFRNRRLIPNVLGLWAESLAAIHLSMPVPFGWRSWGKDHDEQDDEQGTDDANLLDSEII
jgi:hypothetical protein